MRFSEEVEKLNVGSDWTADDLEKYTDLTKRYTKAISKMYGGVSTDTSSLYGL